MTRALAVSVAAALLGATSLAQAASTTLGDVNLKLSGFASVIGAVIDQSNMDGLDQAALAVDTSLFGSAVIIDGDIEYGARIALDIDYASNFESSLNDAGSNTVLNEAWIYIGTPFGRLQAGQQDGAARVLGFRPPSISGSMRVDNPEVFLLGYPCQFFCGDDPQEPGTIFSPNGMQLRSDVHSSDVYLKLSYYSPRIHGFQFGASFTPDGSRNLGEFFGGGNDQRNKQSNIWDLALNYIATVGQVDVGLSVGFVTGENERNDSPGFFDDVEDWGAGFNLGYREWTLGGSYRRTNVAGGGPIVHGFFLSNVYDDMHTEFWSAGLRYDTGPWAFGVNYIFAREDVVFWNDDQEGQGAEVAVAYTISENIRLAAGYQHFEFEGPRDQCNTDSGGPFCDTLDGDVGYLETKFSF